jgi:hypothetical protein
VEWNIGDWHKLLDANRGKKVTFDVYVRSDAGEWDKYSFACNVAKEEIDQYISYRLIEPAYVYYGGMSINQRDLTSFDETVIYNPPFPCDDSRGHCVNCHVPRNQYRDGSSQLHVRQYEGGTLIMTDGKVKKVDLKTDSTLSAGVYPAWHPDLDLIAYSTNITRQYFFSNNRDKVEVLDLDSDIILYDTKSDKVTKAVADSALMETFPAWSPDGNKLYYSVAAYPDSANSENLIDYYDKVHYDILARNFDRKTRTFSAPDTVIYASNRQQSALLPRISPNGKWLLYCMAPYGTFHIWHPASDLYMKNLATGEEYALTEANSDDTDSYHSWSSNSHWIVFSSRRDDGSYTRPYITYIDDNGQASKAFIVPQKSPDYYGKLMKSYNVTEFMVAPINVDRAAIVEAIKGK